MSRIVRSVLSLCVLTAGFMLAHVALAARPAGAGAGTWVELKFKLPAIGNVELVKEWQYGRIANLTKSGQNDYNLELRNAQGSVVRALCPVGPLFDLARESRWLHGSEQVMTNKDYIERMVAYAIDNNGRIIALVSLEPLPRDGRSIGRAYRP